MAAESIGGFYAPSIGLTDWPVTHAHDMATGTFWSRLMEAMADRAKPQTQAAVARLLNIQQPSVHEWKYGGLPTVARCREIAQKLGVCVEWLYTGEGPKRPDFPADPAGQRFWEIWQRLTAESRENVIGYASYVRTTQNTAEPQRIAEFHAELPAHNERHQAKKKAKRD